MPIAGNYSWNDKKDQVKIIIPLKGVSPTIVDILVTSSTLKINYLPYIIDIVLFDKIDAVKHKATVKDGVLIISLFKVTTTLWKSLTNENLIEKHALAEVKAESVLAHEVFEKDMSTKRKDRKIEDERLALRKQMALDEQERTKLDNLKLDEKIAAEKEVYETFSKLNFSSAPITAEAKSSNNKNELFQKDEKNVIETNKHKHIDEFDIDSFLESDDVDDYHEIKNKKIVDEVETNKKLEKLKISENDFENKIDLDDADADVKYVPPPRSMGISQSEDSRVSIKFTPRVFPTPMRESKLAEEDDWVAKNRKHLKKHGMLRDNLSKGNGVDISEEDPAWLKAKGDDFFRSGDAKSAISAYSSALDADKNMITCLANRSACFLKLQMLSECKVDCDEGINQLEKEAFEAQVNVNNASHSLEDIKENYRTSSQEEKAIKIIPHLNIEYRTIYIKLILRRGVALCQLGQFSDSYNDHSLVLSILQHFFKPGQLHEATTLLNKIPGVSSDVVKSDLKNLEVLMRAEKLKKEADALFVGKNIESAINLYSEALKEVPVHVSCLSNRAACKLAISDFQGCADDCTRALLLLELDPNSSVPAAGGGGLSLGNNSPVLSNMITAILPPPGSEKRKSWVIKTLARRGMAYAQKREYEKAVQDYKQAYALNPEDTTLLADIKKIEGFLIAV